MSINLLMSLQTWDSVGIALLACGFRQVTYIETSCRYHGDFRSGVEKLQETFPCPRCGRSLESAVLGIGFTRREQFDWELISSPHGATAKADERILSRPKRRRPDHWRPMKVRQPGEATRQRIILAAALNRLGVSRTVISSELYPEANLAIKARHQANQLFSRHRAAINDAETYLAALPANDRLIAVQHARSVVAKELYSNSSVQS